MGKVFSSQLIKRLQIHRGRQTLSWSLHVLLAIWQRVSVWQWVTRCRQSVTWSAVDELYPVGRRWSGRSVGSPSTGSHMDHLCDVGVISWSSATLCVSSLFSAWPRLRQEERRFSRSVVKNAIIHIFSLHVWAVGQNSPRPGRGRRVGSTHWRFWRPEEAPLSWAESPPARSPSPVSPAREAPHHTWEWTNRCNAAPFTFWVNLFFFFCDSSVFINILGDDAADL